MILAVLLVALLGAYPTHADESLEVKLASPEPIVMNMNEIRDVPISINLSLSKPLHIDEWIVVTLKAETISPQIRALEIIRNYRIEPTKLSGSRIGLKEIIRLRADYIGHAYISVYNVTRAGFGRTKPFLNFSNPTENRLDVTIVQYEGVWGKVFIISVTLFIVISYINLGAQLDSENIRKITENPKAIILGFLITVLVMPLISWLTSLWLLSDQLLYRAGCFIFASGPAASASTLWTVMLDADKELSVGLQVVSMTGALISMPILLYLMDAGLKMEPAGQVHHIQVPYVRLIETLLVLVLALFVGWRFVGRNKRARQISTRIFRPLTFFVLIFIIVFSSIIYWYIYRMFDWTITLTSFIITVSTYLVTGVLGYLINRKMDDAIVVTISSTYKNSGIAFAVLLVAFDTPDTYIAYVPCLTQVVTTSLTLYLCYSIVRLISYLKRRNQPEPIQATATETDEADQSAPKKDTRSGSTSDKSTKSEENADEFIALNVTDIVPGSPLTGQKAYTTSENVDEKEG